MPWNSPISASARSAGRLALPENQGAKARTWARIKAAIDRRLAAARCRVGLKAVVAMRFSSPETGLDHSTMALAVAFE